MISPSVVAAVVTLGSGTAWAQQVVGTPSVTTAPATGHAYNAAADNKVPQNLGAVNYVEAEYFLHGTAHAYAYTTPASPSDAIGVLPGGAVPYVNRILIRAPSDPTKASGNVIVEVINDALLGDNLVQWPYANGEFVRNGDVWIGITSTPTGVQALRSYSSARYGALSWPGLPASAGCAASTSNEPGLIYDQITALGQLIRSGASGINPGGVYPVKHVFLTSYSVSSQILLTYNRVFGPMNPQLWDAYMISSGGYRAPLNACEPQAALIFRATGPTSTTAAVVQTQTISETEKGAIPHGADSDSATNHYRYYDLAGASHVNNDLVMAQPQSSDLAAAGALDVNQSVATNTCMEPGAISTFPNAFVYDAIWDNLEKWVSAGTAPPHATPLNVAASEAGTAVGGLRSPGVDAPLFLYYGSGPVAATGIYKNLCSLLGYQVAISNANLTAMYGTQAGYDQKVILSDFRNYAARFLTTPDALTIFQTPQSSAGE